MPEDEALPKKVRLSDGDFKNLSREELLKRWKQEDAYVKMLERKYSDLLSNSMTDLKEFEEKLKRREKSLVMRLPSKGQEVQKCCTQIRYLKRAQQRSLTQLPASDVDPTVNLLFHKMRCELDQIKAKLEQAQNELSTGKFTPDSQTGKKLMAKCQMLIQENQELRRQLSQGRIAQLEAEVTLQKTYSDQLKSSQEELNDFIIQLDEEAESMQSTILALQHQLKDVRQELACCFAAMSAAPEHPETGYKKDCGRKVTNGPCSTSPAQRILSYPMGRLEAASQTSIMQHPLLAKEDIHAPHI